jgi:hypothetical protein
LKTKFISTDEFSNMIDQMEIKQTEIRIKNENLFNLISKLDQSQLLEIVQPSLGNPPTITTFGACQEGCMDQVSSDIDNLDQSYSLLYFQYPLLSYFIDIAYWSNYEDIVGDFNSCMSSC